MKIELKSVKINMTFSEETIMFQADLYINGKKIGYCKNDGRGGCTDYYPYDKKFNDVIKEAEEYCKNLPPIVLSSFTYSQSLESVIDDLLNDIVDKKEEKKFASTIKRLEKQSVIITKDPEGKVYTYSSLKFNKPIHELISTKVGKDFVKSTVDKYLKEGYRVLNNNLTY